MYALEQRPCLLGLVRQGICLKHDSIRTEQAYLLWIRRFILFHRRHCLPEYKERADDGHAVWLRDGVEGMRLAAD